MMLSDANLAALENTKNADALIAQENARVEEAKKAAAAKIAEIEEQLNSCLQALTRIREANIPAPVKNEVYDYEKEPDADAIADAVADEISANLENLVGTTTDAAPKADPNHPASSTSARFTNLQFGRNYDPNHD